MPKQSRLLVPRLLCYLNTNKVTVVRSWFCWTSDWKSVLVMHRSSELLVIYSTLKPEKDSVKGGQEELALPPFIYKHKSIFLVLCHCRHAVRLRTLSGAWQTGSCPAAAALAEAERLCSVGERHGAGVCHGLLTRQGALYFGNRKSGPGNVASKQLEGLYFPLACSYSHTLWPRSPLPQCF